MSLRLFLMRHWPIIIIVIAASILRFWRLEALTTFSGDQGYDFLVVKRMIVDGRLTLLGPKIGPYNQFGNLYLGPAYYYLIAPFLFLFKFDPIGPAILTVIFALLTILLIYLLGIRFLSKGIALLASSFYAFNSFLIDQSRASSNPHLIPFFSALFIFSVLKIINDKNQTNASIKRFFWPFLAGLSLGIMFQLHYLTISLLPVVIIVLFLNSRLSKLLLIVLAFILVTAPQIIFEFRHQFFITNQFLKQINQGEIISSFDGIIRHLFGSVQSLTEVFSSTNKFNNVLFITIFILILIFVYQPQKFKKPLFLLILTVIFSLLAPIAYSGEIGLHYFAQIYVSLVLLMAVATVALFDFLKNPMLKMVMILVILQIFASNILGLNLGGKEGYTMPKGWNLTGIKEASKIITQDVNSATKFNIAATLDGDTRAMPYRYLVEVYGEKPLGVEEYPNSNVIYLVSRDEEEVIKRYTVWEVASFAPFEINKLSDIQNGIKLYKLEKTQ